jgi:hypothetical protein
MEPRSNGGIGAAMGELEKTESFEGIAKSIVLKEPNR